MKDDSGFSEEGSFMSGEKMNYRLSLLMQINRIGSVPSKVRIKLVGKDDVDTLKMVEISKEVAADILFDSILLLEEMLKPYHDKEYDKEKTALNNTPDPNIKDTLKYAVLDNWKETNEYARGLFGLLMTLMRRKNLLLEEEAEDIVE